MLTVGELKERLDGVDDEVEVRLVEQPSWPFEYSLAGVTLLTDHDLEHDGDHEAEEILYLVEGRQICYASHDLFEGQ